MLFRSRLLDHLGPFQGELEIEGLPDLVFDHLVRVAGLPHQSHQIIDELIDAVGVAQLVPVSIASAIRNSSSKARA